MACSHLDQIDSSVGASGEGCVECLRDGTSWVHLRRCVSCGHIGCCDSSPMRHATAHHAETAHALVQSFEPGEDWLWCYLDQTAFELDELRNSAAHP